MGWLTSMASSTTSISDGFCEVLVDEGEKRLGAVVAVISQSGVRIDRVTMRQTDLEDVFVEFARETENNETSGDSLEKASAD